MGHLVWKVLEILAGRWEEARQLCWSKGAPERKDLDYESEGVAQNESGSGGGHWWRAGTGTKNRQCHFTLCDFLLWREGPSLLSGATMQGKAWEMRLVLWLEAGT